MGATVRSAELHGFADASNVAYAAVVYIRLVMTSGAVSVSLIAGKSRVAPVKPLTVPRLELCGAVLLSRLVEFVKRSLDCSVANVVCWLDSTVALTWVTQPPSRWSTFVANRVAGVQTALPDAQWRHVPTHDNPADCASRGLIGDELRRQTGWWDGPSWLRLSSEHWPENRFRAEDHPPEERRAAIHVSVLPTPRSWDLGSRYSSWSRLLHVTAYMQRFLRHCRPRSTSSDHSGLALTAEECRAAQIFWLRQIQVELFAAEIRDIASHGRVAAKSQIRALNPFVDGDGLLRVGGRLRCAPLPYSERHPIILASHPLVVLIIKYTHVRALHAGLQLTLSTLRREYWIVRSRSAARAVVHKCIVCVRERAAVPAQLMGDLPAARVSPPSRAFLHCGVDYAGPIYVRVSAGRGRASHKAYIALFVCLATRAVHVELVSDCTTAAFRNAFTRFCARRGLPNAIYSDNGTTFVGADREIAQAYRDALRDPDFRNATATDQITWHFIPPSAPHFGGLWEAGVRSVKHHVRRVLRGHALTFEEFATLLCGIEACLNSPPIAPLSDTFDDCEVLTPGHFLIGSAMTIPPEPSVLSIKENRLSRWQLVRQLHESFWKRWSSDYINTLQQRGKWQQGQANLQVGQIVLLRNPTLPPCKWELGRITICHPGADGLTRVVTVKTAASEFKRPIGKLCVLPIEVASKPSASN